VKCASGLYQPVPWHHGTSTGAGASKVAASESANSYVQVPMLETSTGCRHSPAIRLVEPAGICTSTQAAPRGVHKHDSAARQGRAGSGGNRRPQRLVISDNRLLCHMASLTESHAQASARAHSRHWQQSFYTSSCITGQHTGSNNVQASITFINKFGVLARQCNH
jgi:hypothetical protein